MVYTSICYCTSIDGAVTICTLSVFHKDTGVRSNTPATLSGTSVLPRLFHLTAMNQLHISAVYQLILSQQLLPVKTNILRNITGGLGLGRIL